MTEKVPLLRVTPAHIRVGERYRYQIWLGASREVRFESSEGRVIVDIPWDGARHLPREAIDLLQRWPEVEEVRVGWMALGAPLEWEYGWGRVPQADIRPLYMRVRDTNVQMPQAWFADRWRAVLEDSFEVAEPRFQPVEMTFQVFDNWQASKTSLEEWLQRAPEQEDIRLIWELKITVWIPRAVLKAHPSAKVYLEEMRLQWPWVVAKGRDLDVGVLIPQSDDTDSSQASTSSLRPWQWRYSPDRQSIELRKVPFARAKPPDGSSLIPFETRIFFLLRTLGPVITEDVLSGYYHIRVGGALLSGRESAWLDARGQRDTTLNIETFTILSGTLEAYLSESFAIRPVTTYHHWYAPGVSLTEERLRQVAGVLHDMGYRVRLGQLAEKGESRARAKHGDVYGFREWRNQDGRWHRMDLVVRLETAAQYRSRRQRATDAGVTITTQAKAEDLHVHCFGHSTLAGGHVSSEVLTLQERLTQRFESMKDLY